MASPLFDAREREELSDLLDDLGPDAPDAPEAVDDSRSCCHLVLREHDLAGRGLVLPGALGRLAERRRRELALRHFGWLVATIRLGPPPGFFRMGWARRLANLNELFVHYEDVRKANGLGPRTNEPALDEALWRNVGRAPCFSRADCAAQVFSFNGPGRPGASGQGGGTDRVHRRTTGRVVALPLRLSGDPAAVEAVRRARFGM